MSDIAERLKELKQDAANTKGSQAAWEIVNSIKAGEIMWPEIDTIISALQFAEDMQRLKIKDIHGPKYTDDVWTIFHMKGGRRLMAEGKTIFTAARNAVEQMEGK